MASDLTFGEGSLSVAFVRVSESPSPLKDTVIRFIDQPHSVGLHLAYTGNDLSNKLIQVSHDK